LWVRVLLKVRLLLGVRVLLRVRVLLVLWGAMRGAMRGAVRGRLPVLQVVLARMPVRVVGVRLPRRVLLWRVWVRVRMRVRRCMLRVLRAVLKRDLWAIAAVALRPVPAEGAG